MDHAGGWARGVDAPRFIVEPSRFHVQNDVVSPPRRQARLPLAAARRGGRAPPSLRPRARRPPRTPHCRPARAGSPRQPQPRRRRRGRRPSRVALSGGLRLGVRRGLGQVRGGRAANPTTGGLGGAHWTGGCRKRGGKRTGGAPAGYLRQMGGARGAVGSGSSNIDWKGPTSQPDNIDVSTRPGCVQAENYMCDAVMTQKRRQQTR